MRPRSASEILLTEGWVLAATAPDAVPDPQGLAAAAPPWKPAIVPGTVAQALDCDLDHPGDLDAQDWWYRTTFAVSDPEARHALHFDGLATLAEVWLNGQLILASQNMFRAHRCEVTGLLKASNELAIRFRALAPELAARRPRPRWKTALVKAQNLRWIRTTLLGRIPGWTPAVPAIGPWRALRLERLGSAAVVAWSLHTSLQAGVGRVAVHAGIQVQPGVALRGATLQVNDQTFDLAVNADGIVEGTATIPDPPLWWPHTHGTPALLPCRLILCTTSGEIAYDCGEVGFRTLAVDRAEGRVQFAVNGRPIFARGACWTVNDLRALDGDPEALEAALRRAQTMGLNLLRVGGTMTYESEAFYSLCDRLGILVWQDFPFANMDYPFGDEAFRREVEAEVSGQLRRLAPHPSLAVLCGGSEIEQQAAMLGLPASAWSGPFFQEALPAHCEAAAPGRAYFPNTPCEGPLPFHTSEGLTHYYGVGAYRRPLEDARRAAVKFTPECLGFSNVPEPEAMEAMADGALPMPHHPVWKAGVPRDNRAGWDFEDVRDHYLRLLFGEDPVALRSVDPERYYALSRAVTGEVMLRTFAEWRRPGSGCGGALVWFFKDLRPGAGWGLLDSEGRPKQAYWALRRAWAPRAVLLTDEGLEGVHLHLHNETPDPLDASVELELLKGGRQRTGFASAPVVLEAFGSRTLSGDALLGHFADLAHAYRFGPPKHDVVLARLRSATGEVLHEDALLPLGRLLPMQDLTVLSAEATMEEGGTVCLRLSASAFVQTVTLACAGFSADDQAFHLAPGIAKEVRFRPGGAPKPFKVHVGALNLDGTLTVRA